MWVRKSQWRRLLEDNAEKEFRITRLELKAARLEGLLADDLQKSERELNGFIDSLLKG